MLLCWEGLYLGGPGAGRQCPDVQFAGAYSASDSGTGTLKPLSVTETRQYRPTR